MLPFSIIHNLCCIGRGKRGTGRAGTRVRSIHGDFFDLFSFCSDSPRENSMGDGFIAMCFFVF